MLRTLALFDFDGTMRKGDSIVAYIREARRQGLMSRRQYWCASLCGLWFLLGRKTADAMKTEALSFLSALSDAQRARFDRDFTLKVLLPMVSAEAVKRLKAHQKKGDLTLLVTASTENYMEYVREYLGFDALLATPITRMGVVSGNCHGEEKVMRIREYLKKNAIDADFDNSCAYGDSAGDLPMLRMAGHGFRVNPKRRLTALAPELPALRWQ